MKVVAVMVRFLLLFLQTSILMHRSAIATEVKWTPNHHHERDDADDDSAAIRAPKPQKYWDEHNIERPDYAKTDAELMADSAATGGNPTTNSSSSWIPFFVILVAIGGSIGYFIVRPRLLHGKGYTLGSSSSSSSFGVGRFVNWLLREIFPNTNPAVTTRQARLSKFEINREEGNGDNVRMKVE